MPLGPVEILEVKFPGNQFSGEIAPALAELVESGTIRIIDFLFVGRDAEGTVLVTEFNDLGEAALAVFDPLVAEISGMISHDDVAALSEALEPNSSAAIMLFENVWAAKFVQSLRNANAELILSQRIPREVIELAAEAALRAGRRIRRGTRIARRRNCRG
jgi:hypothetical protein